MNPIQEQKRHQLSTAKLRYGWIYGGLAGLVYSLATWGFDAVLLQQAHAVYPWVKLLLGGGVAIPLLALAGWLTARQDSAGIGLVIWGLAAVPLTWLTALLPFDGLSGALILRLDPSLVDRLQLPFTTVMQNRIGVLYLVLGVLAAITGLVELLVIDGARHATASGAKALALLTCMPLIALAGAAADNFINAPVRAPLIALHDTLAFAQRTLGQPIPKSEVRTYHLNGLNPIRGWLDRPYRLVLNGFDDEVIIAQVAVDFAGEWVNCQVINNQPGFCESENPAPAAAPLQQIDDEPPRPTRAASTSPATITTGTQAAAPAATTAPPATHPPDLSAAPRYAISATLDLAAASYAATASLTYTNTESVPLPSLFFRLFPNVDHAYGDGELTVSAARLQGQALPLILSLGDSVLEVVLPSTLAAGASLQLELDFAGRVPRDFGSDPDSGGYGVFNLSEDVLALGSWYPILAVYQAGGWRLDPASSLGDSVFSDVAYYDVQITAPSDQQIAATGETVAQAAQGDQTRWHFVSGPVRDFFLILSPDFEVVSAETDGIVVRSYSLPGQTAAGRQALAVAQASLRAFTTEIGPYPYSEFEVVAAPMQYALGVEWPGIVLIAADLYAEPSDPTFAVTIAHEVAHQWWYNLVGNDVSAEPWLDEALATYTSSFYYEFGLGESPAGLIDYWQGRYDRLKSEGQDEAIAQPLSHFEAAAPGRYSAVVYTKGALFFHALRQEIGDAAFFRALQSYAARYAYGIATGPALLAEFEAAAGRPLEAFYAPWLYLAGGSS